MFFYCNLMGQSGPPNDKNWQIVSAKSDDFTTFNTSLWNKMQGSGYGKEYITPNNVSVSNGKLNLIISYSNPTYYSGGVVSNNFDYSYGYFEIYAKLPGRNYNGQPCGQGFWPAFWTYYETHTGSYPTPCWIILDEIDILEPNGYQYRDAQTNVVGVHDELGSCLRDKTDNSQLDNLPTLFNGYHKFAAEWVPGKVFFYFDDVLFHSYYSDHVPEYSQRTQFNVAVAAEDTLPILTSLPDTMRIDYFRYYELVSQDMNDELITVYSDITNFDYAVKRSITIGTGGSNISLVSGDNVIFRATDYLNILGAFTVPTGSEFFFIPTEIN